MIRLSAMTADDLFSQYAPAGFFDEAFLSQGAPRAHYESLLAGFNAYGDARILAQAFVA